MSQIHRFKAVSAIQNNTIRRVLLLMTFPVLFAINLVLMASGLTVHWTLRWWENNVELCKSFVLRWNEPALKEQTKCPHS